MKTRLYGLFLCLCIVSPVTVAAEAPYFADLIDKAPFAAIYKKLIGGQKLPPWVKGGGTNVPVGSVNVGGRALQLLEGCKPHDCPSEEMLVLYDARTGEAWGVFVRNHAREPFGVDRTELRWLGQPSGALMNALLQKIRYGE